MCGIAGFLGGAYGAQESRRLVRNMTDRLAHRGPDDAGFWGDATQRIALGHQRLAVVELSEAGQQPMQSASGRYVIVFNGEIYNHRMLRRELDDAGVPGWRGHSDTETLLAGFDTWGVAATVERTVGMFAFAVWDRRTASLVLGRDRLGEKPLYYGWQGHGGNAAFLFGSELKALRTHPAFEGRIDRGALCLQLRHNAVPAPYSIYQGIAKLEPGMLLTVSLEQRHPHPSEYWSAARAIRQAVRDPFRGSPESAVDALDAVLREAVAMQMAADVPLGAFLSGGIDSSVVTALMQAQSSRPVRTFSIGFEEPGYNEAEYAKAVARHLGTEHTEAYLSAAEAMDVIPRLPEIYDEPFSDQSQIPTFLVSRLARAHVTVSLSGDGGDELFCGYDRYRSTARMAAFWKLLNRTPTELRKFMAKGFTSASPPAWDRMAGALGRLVPPVRRLSSPGNKLHKAAEALASASPDGFYRGVLSIWHDPGAIVIGGSEPPTLLQQGDASLSGLDPMQRMMALDTLCYLPDDILGKVDRAAMAVSLETRAPFLDRRVFEFAWRLPQSMKWRDGQAKWALRQVLYRYVPRHLVERPKMGFAVPVGAWLKGALRDWGEALLAPARLRNEGYFDPAPIRRKWEEHLAGRRNWEYQLWAVLMFQAWLGAQSTLPAAEDGCRIAREA